MPTVTGPSRPCKTNTDTPSEEATPCGRCPLVCGLFDGCPYCTHPPPPLFPRQAEWQALCERYLLPAYGSGYPLHEPIPSESLDPGEFVRLLSTLLHPAYRDLAAEVLGLILRDQVREIVREILAAELPAAVRYLTGKGVTTNGTQ